MRLQSKRREAFVHSTARVLRVWLWAVLHDRPTYWACERGNWAGVRPPAVLPDQSTMSRRLRDQRTRRMLQELLEALGPAGPTLVRRLDGKPLVVARHSQDRLARFGRGAGGTDRGYKLHAIYGDTNRPTLCVLPLNVDERVAAAGLIGQLASPGYLLADAFYDSNALYDLAAANGQVMLAHRRRPGRGLGKIRHSPHRLSAIDRVEGPGDFARDLLATRRGIETRFAHLCNFGGGLTHLPPWVGAFVSSLMYWAKSSFALPVTSDSDNSLHKVPTGKGWGEGGASRATEALLRSALTLTLSRRTGRGDQKNNVPGVTHARDAAS